MFSLIEARTHRATRSEEVSLPADGPARSGRHALGKGILALMLSAIMTVGVAVSAESASAVERPATIAAASATMSAVTSGPTTALTTAPTSVGSCPVWYTCTVYFSNFETSVWAHWGQVPPVPAWLPWQIQVAYYGAIYGLRPFAWYYASHGMCSGFRISLVPWSTQGYFGYYC